MKNHWLFFLLISLLVLSCNKDEEGRVEQGYRPVYIDKSTALAVSSESAQAIENPGKIYIYGNMILLNERYKGIHVIDNSNPKSPSVVSFIRIYGNRDMAVKANVLYAD
ncbi:MAG: hypothetical protein KKA07_12560, partial [Bacteroidetes bacterium]|nr:hypothetical protein [Bacteroidota bacterium]